MGEREVTGKKRYDHLMKAVRDLGAASIELGILGMADERDAVDDILRSLIAALYRLGDALDA